MRPAADFVSVDWAAIVQEMALKRAGPPSPGERSGPPAEWAEWNRAVWIPRLRKRRPLEAVRSKPHRAGCWRGDVWLLP
jgi:hypothetical protein